MVMNPVSPNKIDNAAIYDANWNSWVDMKLYGPMSRHTRRLVFKACRGLKFSSVLDVGCGPGVFLKDFCSHYREVRKFAGIDLSSGAIDLARSRIPEGIFYQIDITKEVIPYPFDLVTMIDVAEHIQEDETAFLNIRKMCSKYLVLVTLEGRMRDFEADVGHVRNYKKGELEKKLNNSGFRVKKYINWGFPVFSPIYRNICGGLVKPHKRPLTKMSRILGNLFYYLLACNIPGKGDFVVVVAEVN